MNYIKEKICKCGHTRDMHRTPIEFKGSQPPTREKDIMCTATDCSCKKYIAEEETLL